MFLSQCQDKMHAYQKDILTTFIVTHIICVSESIKGEASITAKINSIVHTHKMSSACKCKIYTTNNDSEVTELKVV